MQRMVPSLLPDEDPALYNTGAELPGAHLKEGRK